MKKWISYALAAVCLLLILIGCTPKPAEDFAQQEQAAAEASGLDFHKIGVATYDIKDPQIQMFKHYLDGYIKECFPDVTFLYSSSIQGGDALMSFLEQCSQNDVDGVLVFGSYDLQKEVEFCAAHEMYYIRPSASSSDEDFRLVADNPYFLGEIGPGSDSEKQAGYDMASAMVRPESSYVILSGGSAMGNEMHRLRTAGILEALEEAYDVQLDPDLALLSTPTVIEEGNLKAVILPGYLAQPKVLENAEEVLASGQYSTILSTGPISQLLRMDAMKNITSGVIDCFSEENYYGFQSGEITYVVGKYQSEIGPGFAALYNALNGHGNDFRDAGKAFRLKQGFWTASDPDEYNERYALSVGSVINAYDYEDLYGVIKRISPEADFAAFRELVESCSYEACLARRSQ